MVCEKYNNDININISTTTPKKPTENDLLEKLELNIQKDVFLRRTLVGPHTDKYTVFFKDKPLREYGSQGEHKLSFVLLKVAEHGFIKKETNIDLSKAKYFAGHSLGEYSALTASGSINFSSNITNTHSIGNILYTEYIHLFQLSGMILLVAMIGAIVLTFRKRSGVKKQSYFKQISREKKDGVVLTDPESNKGVKIDA